MSHLWRSPTTSGRGHIADILRHEAAYHLRMWAKEKCQDPDATLLLMLARLIKRRYLKPSAALETLGRLCPEEFGTDADLDACITALKALDGAGW